MRIVFIGTGEIGLPVLRSLLESEKHELVGIVTQPDKPVGRAQIVTAPPIKAAVTGTGIPVLQPERIKREEAVAEIRTLRPDVIVVMAYGQILPPAVLDIPAVACLNLHASLLPRHRGAAPIQAAIAAGDAETGITVMYMDESLDTGDILLQSRTNIAPNETGGSLHDRLAEIAPEALQQALDWLENGTAPRRPQDSTHATYAPKLEREDGRIDWSKRADAVERQIRAFDPWPGAYIGLQDSAGRDRKLKIFRAERVPADVRLPPGHLQAGTGGLTVGAADGALLLDAVQLEGKKRMQASELLRGNPWIASAQILPRP